MKFDVDESFVREVEEIRRGARRRGDFRKAYRDEYLRSRHWAVLNDQMPNFREKKCEICCKVDSVELHHLQYRKWHDVTPYDLIWLCRKHHEVIEWWIENKHFPEQKGESQFLLMDTMRILLGYDKNRLEKDLTKLNKEIENLSEQEPQKLIEPKLNRRIKALFTLIAILTSFSAGFLLRSFMLQPRQTPQNTIERSR